MKKIKELLLKIHFYMFKLPFYDSCGCDACHWEVIDFKLFYWVKDWDIKNPKWKFTWRKNGK